MTPSNSFYITGGNLPPDALSYVIRDADTLLLQHLLQGQFCYILTSRQMGKSSLMTHTVQRLREQHVAPAVLDLSSQGFNLEARQWYNGLLEQLGRRLKLTDQIETFCQAHRHLSPLQLWQHALRDVVLEATSQPVVIFIDEIDGVRSLPFSTDEFFAAIRACYNARTEDAAFNRLSFCLLGVATPADLIADPKLTPFNIGVRIELGDFTRAEASLLEPGLGQSAETNRALMDRIYHWTGGHPYLTQRLCQGVAAAEVITVEGVDACCGELFLSAQAQRRDSNLLFVQQRLVVAEEEARSGLLTLYSRVLSGKAVADSETIPYVSELKLTGVVRGVEGRLQVRNRIYARVFDPAWVRESLPGAELRRQQAAYRRGLVRALALSSAVLAVIVGLAVYGFVQARRANHNASLARKATRDAQIQADTAEHTSYIARMNLIQRDWEINDVRDVLDLLAATRKSRFQGFEWGYWNRMLHLDLLTLKGHTNRVLSVAYSPDGKRILTGSWDQTAKVWNAQTGQEALSLNIQRGVVSSVAFSPDGKRIVTGIEDGTARVWDAVTGQETLTLKGHTNQVDAVAFSPDGKHILTGSYDGTAKVWDATTGRELLTLKGHMVWVLSAAFSPDGKRIVTGSYDNTARVWDAATGQEALTLKGHTNNVSSVAFSPDGKRIITGSWDNMAKVWDATTGRETFTFNVHTNEVSCAFSPDGKWIISIVKRSGANTAEVWYATTGREMFTLKGHTGFICFANFSPDGKRIVTGSNDKTAKVWDTATGREILTLKGHTDAVYSAAFSPDGKRIVTGSNDNTAKVWDAATGQETLTLKGHTDVVFSVAFFPDGKRIFTESRDATTKIWETSFE